MFTKYTPVYKPRRPQSTDWRGGPVFMNVQNTKAPNVFNERSEHENSTPLVFWAAQLVAYQTLYSTCSSTHQLSKKYRV